MFEHAVKSVTWVEHLLPVTGIPQEKEARVDGLHSPCRPHMAWMSGRLPIWDPGSKPGLGQDRGASASFLALGVTLSCGGLPLVSWWASLGKRSG